MTTTAPTAAARHELAPTRRRRGRIVLVLLAGLLVALGGTFTGLWVVTPAAGDAPRRVTALLASQGADPLAALPNPDRVGLAVVAAEDRRFFSHSGVDPVALGRVISGHLLGKGDQGGATLDQQLAKLLYTPGSGGARAEVEQVLLALKLDRKYSKADLLRMYLDVAYFGHGYYGLVDAARGYFGTTPDRLTWGQASLLAGLLPAPSSYDPLAHPDLARQREQHVLDRLVAVGRLSSPEAKAAYAAPLGLTGPTAQASVSR